MTRFLICLLSLVILACPDRAAAEPDLQRMPELSGYYLDGRKASVPSGLEGPVTLVVFLRGDQGRGDLQNWRDVASQHGDNIDTVFIVLMGARRGIDRALAAGRLRAQIRDPEFRASMVPVFQEGRNLRIELGLGADASGLFVNQVGEIVGRVGGAVDTTLPADIGGGQTPPAVPAPAGALVLKLGPEPTAPEPARAPAKPERVPAPSVLPDAPVAPRTTTPARMPALRGVTLSGRTVQLPGDMSKVGMQLLLIPDSDGIGALRASLEWMQTNAAGDWLVLVFRGETPRFGRAVATGRLRRLIEPAPDRDRVLPVYMDILDFEQLTGLGPCRTLSLITLDTAGAISGAECLLAPPPQQ